MDDHIFVVTGKQQEEWIKDATIRPLVPEGSRVDAVASILIGQLHDYVLNAAIEHCELGDADLHYVRHKGQELIDACAEYLNVFWECEPKRPADPYEHRASAAFVRAFCNRVGFDVHISDEESGTDPLGS